MRGRLWHDACFGDRHEVQHTTKEEVNDMVKRILAIALTLSVLGVLASAPDAQAKRRCPRGYDDVNNVCVPK